MKKIFWFVTVLAMCICVFTISAGAEKETNVDVYINGEALVTDQSAIAINGITLVPLRAVSEKLGCFVYWDDESKTAIIYNDFMVTMCELDSYVISQTDEEFTDIKKTIDLDVPANAYNGRILVPAKALAESMAADVIWNEETNRVEITTHFDEVGLFIDGTAPAKKGGKFGIIDENRNTVLPFTYDGMICNFGEENVACVTKDEKFGLITKKGEILTDMVYDYIDKYTDGLCAVSLNNKWGYLDNTGNQVIDIKYEHALSFSDKTAIVGADGKFGFININGEVIVPIIYDYAEDFISNIAYVELNGKCGYINVNGEEIIPIIYDIEESDRYPSGSEPYDKINMYLDGKVYYYDYEGNLLD